MSGGGMGRGWSWGFYNVLPTSRPVNGGRPSVGRTDRSGCGKATGSRRRGRRRPDKEIDYCIQLRQRVRGSRDAVLSQSHTCPTTQALKEGWSAGMVAISTASPTPITMRTTIPLGQPPHGISRDMRSGRRQNPSSVQPSIPPWFPPPNPGGALPRLAPAALSPSASNLKM